MLEDDERGVDGAHAPGQRRTYRRVDGGEQIAPQVNGVGFVHGGPGRVDQPRLPPPPHSDETLHVQVVEFGGQCRLHRGFRIPVPVDQEIRPGRQIEGLDRSIGAFDHRLIRFERLNPGAQLMAMRSRGEAGGVA